MIIFKLEKKHASASNVAVRLFVTLLNDQWKLIWLGKLYNVAGETQMIKQRSLDFLAIN